MNRKKMMEETNVLYPEGAFIPPGNFDYLVMVDVQNDFITGSLGSQEAREAFKNILGLCMDFDWRKIIYTKDTHGLDYFDTLEGRNLPVEHCVVDTAGWCLPNDLQKLMIEKSSMEIRKGTFGTFDIFNETGLENVGKGNYEDSRIFVCGLCTDICVISNILILKAKFPETEIICITDACAGSTPERHKAALEVMKSCQVKLMTVDEIPCPSDPA